MHHHFLISPQSLICLLQCYIGLRDCNIFRLFFVACKIFLRVPYVNTLPPRPGHEVFWAWKSDRISFETGSTTYWLCGFGRVAYLLWTSTLKGRIIWSWDETRLWMWKSNTVFYLDFKLSSRFAHTSGNPYRTESLEGVPEAGPTLLRIVSYPERTANTWMMRQVLKLPKQAGPGFLNLGTRDP